MDTEVLFTVTAITILSYSLVTAITILAITNPRPEMAGLLAHDQADAAGGGLNQDGFAGAD
jgi:hypothetical protein